MKDEFLKKLSIEIFTIIAKTGNLNLNLMHG